MSDQTLILQLEQMQSQLAFIQHELEEQKCRREEWNELKEDLTVIAKDVFHTAIVELDDIAPFVRTGDFLHLFKKILRNTNNIGAVIDKFESMMDFVDDVRPISKVLFNDMLMHLDELDRKGYFLFLKEVTRIIDNVITHFTVEDVRLLAENIVTILETVKGLTQPEMLKALNNAIQVYRHLDVDHVKEYSVLKIMKELNTPEMKRGLGFIVFFLKNISKEPTKQPTT